MAMNSRFQYKTFEYEWFYSRVWIPIGNVFVRARALFKTRYTKPLITVQCVYYLYSAPFECHAHMKNSPRISFLRSLFVHSFDFHSSICSLVLDFLLLVCIFSQWFNVIRYGFHSFRRSPEWINLLTLLGYSLNWLRLIKYFIIITLMNDGLVESESQLLVDKLFWLIPI